MITIQLTSVSNKETLLAKIYIYLLFISMKVLQMQSCYVSKYNLIKLFSYEIRYLDWSTAKKCNKICFLSMTYKKYNVFTCIYHNIKQDKSVKINEGWLDLMKVCEKKATNQDSVAANISGTNPVYSSLTVIDLKKQVTSHGRTDPSKEWTPIILNTQRWQYQHRV